MNQIIRLLHILFLAFILLTNSFTVISQDSVYISMSADWSKTYSLGTRGVSDGVSIVDDKTGNIYVASQQREYSGVMTARILKLNNRGEVIWNNRVKIVSEKAQRGLMSDATALELDSEGNLIVMGIVRNSCKFTSKDNSTAITLTLERGEYCFVAKYNPKGILLWAKTFNPGKDRYILKSVNIDEKGNIYFSGMLLIGVKNGNSYSTDPAILAGKLNSKGDLLWYKYFNSEGRDVGVASVLDSKGYFYIGAVFENSILIDTDSLKVINNRRNSFVAKFNPKGNLVWTLSPESAFISLDALTIDNQDRLYMAGQYRDTLRFHNCTDYIVSKKYNNLFVASFNKRGKVLWLENITDKWKAISYDGLKKMKVGDDGFLYLSGGALEMSMELANSKYEGFVQEYGKKSMHAEGFVIKYDREGNALWLRTVSGKSNQIVTDFVVNKNSDITIAGHLAGELSFKNTSSKPKGNTYFAKIKASKLLDTGPDSLMVAQQKEAQRRKSINMDDCSCEEYTESVKGTNNFYPLSIIANDKVINSLSELFGGVSLDSLPLLVFDINHGGSHFEVGGNSYFSLFTSKQIKIKPAKDAITINITPCELMQSKYNIIPASFSWSHSIRNRLRGFDEDKFKGLGREYYDLAVSLNYMKFSNIYYGFIGEDEDEISHPFVDYLNSKYKINLDSYESPIEEQLEKLGKDIDLSDEIYNFYLKPEESKEGMPTTNFISELDHMIYRSSGDYTFEIITGMIYPRYRASVDVKRFKLEFSNQLINSEYPWAMFRADKLEWTSKKGIEVDYREMDQFCMMPFEIGSSGVIVSITEAYPDLTPFVNTFRDDHRFIVPKVPSPLYEPIGKLSPEFIGIFTKQCEVQIPFGKNLIIAKGVDLLISNSEIKGWLEISPSDKYTSDELVKRLTELQFHNVQMSENKETRVFSFSYKI